MIFDLSFLDLELEAAKTGSLSPALTGHPAFRAIAEHEAELQRPVWDADSFSTRFSAAAAGKEGDWGLAPLFQERERLEGFRDWLETEKEALTALVRRQLERFTGVPQNPELRCIPYVGSYDAGFSPDVGNGAIYLNLPVLSSREGFLETLVHESYHARKAEPKTRQKAKQLEFQSSPMTQLLFFTAEEGAASLVGNNGLLASQNPVIPLRAAEEGYAELKQLLGRFCGQELDEQAALEAFLQTDCCYTGGVYIAYSVWKAYGRDGMDTWSARADLDAYYQAFRSAPQGADWPALSL